MANWGKEDKVDDAPSFITNSFTGETGQDEYGTKVFGVDVVETQVHGRVHGAGWVRAVKGTGGRAGRTQYEILVASRTLITGDGDDNTEFPNTDETTPPETGGETETGGTGE